jgi:hypothetical protein
VAGCCEYGDEPSGSGATELERKDSCLSFYPEDGSSMFFRNVGNNKTT